MNNFDFLWQWDRNVFLRVNGLSGSRLDYFLAWPSFLGRGYILLGIVFLLMLIWDSGNILKRFSSLTLSLLGIGLLVRILKEVIDRPRPYQYFYEEIAKGKVIVNCIFEMGVASSFPSGHAASAFAAAVILNYFYPQKLSFLYLLALVISISRIYTGAHFPLDVISGAMVGIIGGRIAVFILGRFFLKTCQTAPENPK